MVLFWKNGPMGRLWIDESVLKEQVASCLPEGTSCSSIQFLGDRDLVNAYVSFGLGDAAPDAREIQERVSEKLAPLGLAVSISLVAGAPVAAKGRERPPLRRSPLFWGLALGGLAAFYNLGLSGVFWVLFFGLGAWGIAWLFLTPRGRDRIASFLDHFEE